MKIIKISQENNVPNVMWHISNAYFKSFDASQTAQGILWFSKNKGSLISDGHGAGITNSKPIYLYECSTTAKNPANWDEYDKYGLWELESKGYDSIDLGNDFVVLDAKDVVINRVDVVKR